MALKEGEVNEIKIEVSAEDGTTKVYVVNIHRLSAKEAILSSLKLDIGSLCPDFSEKCLEYEGSTVHFISAHAEYIYHYHYDSIGRNLLNIKLNFQQKYRF